MTSERAHAASTGDLRSGDGPHLRSISYLCLQPMHEGQASFAHVGEITAGLRRLGWDVRIAASSAPPRAALPRRLWATVRPQATLVRHARPDVLYVRWHPAAVLAVAWAAARRIPVVQELNGPPEDFVEAWPALRRLEWLIAASLRWQLRRARLVITVTEGMRSWAHGLVGRTTRVAVVANGADPDRFVPVAPQGGAVDRRVVFFGALAPWQGVETLLSATSAPEWPDDVRLVVVGDGPLRLDVERAVHRRPDRIEHVGHVPYAEMPAVISTSAVAIIPKDHHRPELGQSPLKLYEAMSCQVPVVVTDLPGLGDVVRAEGCGIVVPAGDATGIARAVARLLEDPALARRCGENGRRAVLERHSWSRRAACTSTLLRETVA